MTPAIAALAHALLAFLTGAALQAAVRPAGAPRWRERLAMAVPLGCAVIFLSGLFGYLLGQPVHWLPPALAALFLAAAARARGRPVLPWAAGRAWLRGRPWRRLGAVERLLLGIMGVQACILLWGAFWRPFNRHDDILQWAGHAKYLYAHGPVDAAYFQTVNLPSYPLFLPINELVTASFLGAWDEFAPKVFLVLLLGSAALAVYDWVRGYAARPLALAAAFLMLTMPFYSRVTLDATGEIPVSLYLALAVIAGLRAARRNRSAELLVLALVGAALAGLKAEAAFAFGAVSAVLLLASWRRHRRAGPPLRLGLAALLGLALAAGPWEAIQYRCGSTSGRLGVTARTAEEMPGAFGLAWLAEPESYIRILADVGATAVPRRKDVFLTGTFLAVALLHWLLSARDDHQTLWCVLALAAVAAVYAGGAYSTGWPEQYPRLLTHLTGVAILVIARQACLATGWRGAGVAGDPRLEDGGARP